MRVPFPATGRARRVTLLTAAACAALAAMASPVSGEKRAGPGAPPAPPLTSLRALPSPAGPGSVAPHLSRSHDGEVWLSWIERRSRGGHALRVSRLAGHRWNPPMTVTEGDSFFVNWADRPGVTALGEGCLAAHWLWTTSAVAYSYDVRVSFSGDKGRTWSNPICPHRDATPTEHGFVAMLPEGNGVRAIWLDGRNYAAAREKQAAALGGTDEHGVDADMTVRTALIHPDGTLADEVALDGRACDCCPTAAVRTMSGFLVAFRDRAPDEVRDISLVRRAEGLWSEPYPLHVDGWKIPGCPVNGPAMDAEDDRVVAAWYSEAGDSMRVRVAFSKDGGRSFGAPIRVDEGAPLGRVDVALLEDRTALALWLESGGAQARIVARRASPDGGLSPPLTIAATSSRRASGYPRMVQDGRRVIFAWTEAGDPSGVRVGEAMAGER